MAARLFTLLCWAAGGDTEAAEMLEVNRESMQVLLLEALAFGGFLWAEESALLRAHVHMEEQTKPAKDDE
eukprot:6932-Prorocentrum_minimum.AAC.6